MEVSNRYLDTQGCCSEERITMESYVNIHSTEIAVGVTKINEVKMGKYTNLGEKKAKGRMIKDK